MKATIKQLIYGWNLFGKSNETLIRLRRDIEGVISVILEFDDMISNESILSESEAIVLIDRHNMCLVRPN